MNKVIPLFAIVLFLASCNPKKNATNENTMAVTVSILPEKTFIEEIAGNDFKINILIPPGTSPEAGNLLPSQLKDIARSQVWFRMGHIGFEYSWREKIEQANPKMKVVDLSEGLDLIKKGEHHNNDFIHGAGIDPHIWLSPKLVKQIAGKIYQELAAINPKGAEKYKTNYERFLSKVNALDNEISKKLNDYQGRKIIVFHPSLSYYARDYGLDQWALESGGKEPALQHMAKVVEMAKKENIKVIYIQSEFDRENARVFAEEIDGKIIQVSPLDPNWFENLRDMTRNIVENF
ncbi:MAG: zinc ABC transporter substrate-binding protein [Draconibacterium sp.]|nr:MAG: zinc ABC transporter substrate-binding protein [Draconibacterium sp.]